MSIRSVLIINLDLQNGYPVERPWAGVISCHTKDGWYPAATFLEPRGECNMGNRLFATEIGNLKYTLKYMKGIMLLLFFFLFLRKYCQKKNSGKIMCFYHF